MADYTVDNALHLSRIKYVGTTINLLFKLKLTSNYRDKKCKPCSNKNNRRFTVLYMNMIVGNDMRHQMDSKIMVHLHYMYLTPSHSRALCNATVNLFYGGILVVIIIPNKIKALLTLQV